MKVKTSFKTAQGYLSATPSAKSRKVARFEYRQQETPGAWETVEIDLDEIVREIVREVVRALQQSPSPPSPPVHPPSVFDPAVRQPWPRPMPPDIDTTNLLEVTDRVDWTLQYFDCSDPRSLWVGYVMDTANEGHDKGWKADGYWRLEKMAKAEGNGKGYVWPPR